MMKMHNWGPIDVYDVSSGKSVKAAYKPLERAINEWNLAVLIPDLKDSVWKATVYGLVEEAQRLGQRMTILNAGGYGRENEKAQQAQFDQCIKADYDAIITAPVAEAGMADRFAHGLERGIPQVGLMYPVSSTMINAQVGPDFDALGFEAGRYLSEFFQGETFHVATFPGPQGLGWVESLLTGFKAALKDSSIEIVAELYGEPNTADQLKLVNDALRDFPELDIIWGTAPTAEVAIQLISDACLEDRVFVMSAWENQRMPDALNRLKILGFIAQYPVHQGHIAVDQAVRLLEGHTVIKHVRPIQALVTKATRPHLDESGMTAPADWEPVFTVEPAAAR